MNEKTISVESHSRAILYNKLTKDDENIMSYHKCSYFHLVNTEHSNSLTTDLIEMFECLGINIVKDNFRTLVIELRGKRFTVCTEIAIIFGTVRFRIRGGRLRYKRYDAHFLKKK